MAKIRGIKPSLWTNDDFVEMSPLARLLWVGMWNFACDNGHLEDRPKQIKMRILPVDDVNCAELIRELAADPHPLIYRDDGWITIPKLTHHQRVDRRYFTTCEKPGCVKPDEHPKREARRAPDETTRAPSVPTSGPRVDGDGDGELMVMVSGGDKSPPAKRATQIPKDWQPTEKHVALAAERRVNITEEAEKFRDWCISTGATKKDWDATFRNWIRNARPSQHAPTAKRPPHVSQLHASPPPGLSPEESDQWAWGQHPLQLKGQ